MLVRTTMVSSLAMLVVAFVTLQAAALSRQQADAFQRKIDAIARQGSGAARPPARRTPVTESEVNSWFAYRAQPLLPRGVADPQITIVGNGKVMGNVVVDLGAVSKNSSSGSLNPFSYFGGRVPVSVSGVLQTQDGRGRFDVESADVGGLPVPRPLLQELLSYYSKTESHPQGIRLDDPFELPANIQKIEVGQGQAVVVQ
jgi:hypothetical protein